MTRKLLGFRFTYTRLWFRWLLCWIDARTRLARAENPEGLAAYCLFHLNRSVRKVGRWSHFVCCIYVLKSRLIEHLYLAGRCTSATLQVQKLVCHRCWGSGEDPEYYDDECDRCGGTGIYRQYELIRFAFDIDGQHYVWHQPRGIVTWPVHLTDDQVGEYEDTPAGSRCPLDDGESELLYVTLYEYLRARGCLRGLAPSQVAWPRLLQSICDDLGLPRLFDTLNYRIRRFCRRLRLTRRSAIAPAFVQEDEIPF